MFEKNMTIAYLLDFYGDALDEHTATVMRAYYNDDLSLAEIAADEGISRQGIRHLIKKGEEQLSFFENTFGLAKRHGELSEVCKSLSGLCDKLAKDEDNADIVQEIKRDVAIIMKGNQDVRESY